MKTALTGLVLWLLCAAAVEAEKVSFIKIDGAIGPATASYISRSIEEARTQNAQCLIIQLNTPGGLLDSTQNIVQSFLGSPVPIVVYVAPTGATATSAGCFITIAASVAAMAPATTIGAAHPVSIGGFPSGGEEDVALGTYLPEALAAGGHVCSDAHRDLRDHRRTNHARRDSSWGGRRDCVGPRALSGGHPAG